MASNSPLIRLPVIDFSKPELKPGTPDWDSLRAQVRQALEEYGCFEALFNKVQLELRKALLGAIDELFDLPLPTKLRNISKRPFHGYIGQHPEVPLYESLGIDDANIPEKVENVANIFWPEGKQSFWYTSYSLGLMTKVEQPVTFLPITSFRCQGTIFFNWFPIEIYIRQDILERTS